jgi:hypothetical protein
LIRIVKYFASNRLDSLRTRTLRVSQPRVFNDPFEALPAFTTFQPPERQQQLVQYARAVLEESSPEDIETRYREQLSRLAPGVSPTSFPPAQSLIPKLRDRFGDLLKEYIDAIDVAARAAGGYAALQEDLNSMFGIVCFSGDPLSLLMWSHYADHHRGFVVEFDPTHPFFDQRAAPTDPIRWLRPVEYSPGRRSLMVPAIGQDDGHYQEEVITATFLTKAEEWRYDEEWRMVLPPKDAEVVGTDLGGSDVHVVAFPPAAVTGIILGARASDELVNACQSILGCPEWAHVPLRKAALSVDRYALVIEP